MGMTNEKKQHAYALRFFIERLQADEKWSLWTEEISSLTGLMDWTKWEYPDELAAAKVGTSGDAGDVLLVRTNVRFICMYTGNDGSPQVIEFPYDEISSMEVGAVSGFGVLTLDIDDTRFAFYMDREEAGDFANHAREVLRDTRDNEIRKVEQWAYAMAYMVGDRRLDEYWSVWEEELRELIALLDMDEWELPEQFAEARFGPSDDSKVQLLVRTNVRFISVFKGRDGSPQYVDFPYDELSSVASGTDSNFGKLTLETGERTFAFYMGLEEARDFADFARAKMRDATAGFAQSAPPAAVRTASPVAPAQPTPQAATQSTSVADELVKLADLLGRGLLTDEEFTLAKERLLR